MDERRWTGDIVEIGDRIANLTPFQAQQLGRYLDQTYGLQPQTRSLDRLEDRMTRVITDPEHIFVRDTVDVRLEGFDPAKKVQVIKVVRQLTGLGLKEAKDFVEGPPQFVKTDLAPAEGEELRAFLIAAGAKASIRSDVRG